MKKFILLLLLISISVTSQAQTEKEKVQETVSQSQIEGHIYFLADDLLKGRATGTPENKIAASYLANTLRSYGVKPNPESGDYYQPVPLEKVSPPATMSLSLMGEKISEFVALDSGAINYNENAIFVNYGLKEDYSGHSVKGKVVVMKAGSKEANDARGAFRLRDEKMDIALKSGAVAIIELVNAADQMWGFLDHNFNEPSLGLVSSEMSDNDAKLPHLWVKDTDFAMATKFATSRSLLTALNLSPQAKELVTSQNVIGIVEGTDPVLKNEYIIYSAHYDHVGIGTPDETGDNNYNGARDNAVGTTTVLSMAQNLAKYPTKRSALFILFTGEEKGLLGSEYYVANPVLPLNQMVYCFNSDNAGYNDTSLATIVGLERTTASQHIKDAATAFGITAIDDPAPEQGLFDRSDNVHFAKAGIPAPTFSLGFTAFNGDVTKYYHRPGDEADTLDYEYLYKFFSAYVMAGRNIGNDPVTPVWTKGDKYEEAGNKLYGN